MVVAGAIAAKRLRIYRNLQSLDLDVVYTFDTEGKVATVTYPNGGPTYQNQYDTMGRLSGMIQNLIRDGVQSYVQWAGNVVYGPANELKQLQTTAYQGSNLTQDTYNIESRTYNNRLQLTGLTSGGLGQIADINLTYTYSSTANNGQLISTTDNKYGGETVSYSYDALKRLITASSSTASWGQSFAYDGFGNMTNQTVTQGSAPSMTLLYDNNTNRILTAGYSYDANGNMTGTPSYYNAAAYDASNRMVTAFASGGYQQYGYAPDNKRIYVRKPDGTEQIHFYSGNQRLGIYTTNLQSDGTWHLITVTTQKYFGGRKIETMDRLGSDIRGTKYFPYGAEATATASDRDKFATYYRDSTTGLDYADQRFYSSTIGRFMSPDPYQASGGPDDPASWNRYAYVENDPANRNDPTGRYFQDEPAGFGDPFWGLGADRDWDWEESGWLGGRKLACLSGNCLTLSGGDWNLAIDDNTRWDLIATGIQNGNPFVLGLLQAAQVAQWEPELERILAKWGPAIFTTVAGWIQAMQASRSKSQADKTKDSEIRKQCEDLAHARADRLGYERYGKEWLKTFYECVAAGGY